MTLPSEQIADIFWKDFKIARDNGKFKNTDLSNSVAVLHLNIQAIIKWLDKEEANT